MRRRRLGAGAVIAGMVGSLGLVTAPGALAAPSTVHEAGFESGTDSWFGRGGSTVASSTDSARTGARSLAVTGRTQNWEGPGLDANALLPAGAYDVEAWVKLPTGSGTDQVTLTAARTPTGGTTSYDTIGTYNTAVSDSGWTKVGGTYTFATANSSLELYIESPDATQSFYVDDVKIVGEAAAPAQPGALVSLSGGFEDGTTQGWNPRGDARVAVTAGGAHGGSNSLSVTNRLQDWQGASLDITRSVGVGRAVEVSVWVKLLPGQAPASLQATVQLDKAGASTQYQAVPGASVVANADTWTQLKGRYTLGSTVDTAQLYIEGTVGASYMLDDFSVEEFIETPIQDVPGLKDVLGAQGFEHVGVAIDSRETVGRSSALLQRHYNAITPENDGKPEVVQPTEGTFDFTNLDRLLDYADATGIDVYYHVLAWHSQTPAWFFKDGDRDLTNSPADQALLRARLDAHVKAIADHVDARYPDGDSPIWAMDVVNEVINDGDNANPHDMRDSRWFQVLGETFVDDAFRIADEHFPEQELFINDYNSEFPEKRADYLSLVDALQDRGVPIDGVGHQAHMDFARPVQWLDDSLTAVEELGASNGKPLLQVITELDISTSAENFGADVSGPDTPQHRPGMTDQEESETENGYYYRDLFDMLRTHSASIESVTFWGIDNSRSWLRTWPAARPWEAPLPFDDDLQVTPAYWGIVDPTQLAPRPADQLAPRVLGQPAVTATATSAKGAKVTFGLPEARDTRDGLVKPTCDHASGALFPIGTTTVECTAKDAAGNEAKPASFDVVVTTSELEAVVTGPATVEPGSSVTYTLTVTNDGAGTATGLLAALGTDTLTASKASPKGGTGTIVVDGKRVKGFNWKVPTLAPGQSATFTVTGKAPKAGSTVNAVGGAQSATYDADLSDNSSRTSTTTR